jgi:hypothetical protein
MNNEIHFSFRRAATVMLVCWAVLATAGVVALAIGTANDHRALSRSTAALKRSVDATAQAVLAVDQANSALRRANAALLQAASAKQLTQAISDLRRKTIERICEAQNHNHDSTLAYLNSVIRKVKRHQTKSQRISTNAARRIFSLLFSRLQPLQNCATLVKQET